MKMISLLLNCLVLQVIGDCQDGTLCPASFSVDSDSSAGDGACDSIVPDSTILEGVRATIENEVTPQLNTLLRSRHLGMISRYPARSCAELLQADPDIPSGYYWIQTTGNGAARMWCNMELTCGPNINGWTRVAFLNVSDSNTTTCLNDRFRLLTSSRGVRYCERLTGGFGCTEYIFPTNGINYDKVCGRVTGIQIGTIDGVERSVDLQNINSPYIDGISLTYGDPRQHIWSFIGYFSSRYPNCPCSNESLTRTLDFVGQDFFCESGTNLESFADDRVFDEDPLWDGMMCLSTEAPCCNRLPWFYKHLVNTVSDNISFRVCCDQEKFDEDIAFTLVELYIQ